MRVTVELHGNLRQYAKHEGARIEVEVEAGTTVGELMTRLGVSADITWNAALDGRLVYAADPLAEGAALVVFPPLAGG
jgi:molybdopterin converting factor small subunit